MSRGMQSVIAVALLLFGLLAGTGQSFALSHADAVPCADATVALGSVTVTVPGCEKGMMHQTCAADGVCSFLIFKDAVGGLEPHPKAILSPVALSSLTGSHTPPDTPPPIVLS